MDLSTVMNLIASVGFPIVCCVFLFDSLNKEREAHKEETKQMTDAVQNNTLVMQKLIDKLSNLKEEE